MEVTKPEESDITELWDLPGLLSEAELLLDAPNAIPTTPNSGDLYSRQFPERAAAGRA